MTNLITTGGQITAGAPVQDHFALAFAPSKPTFDAMAKLRPALNWLADGDRTDPHRNGIWLDVERADDWVDEADRRLAFIPEETILKRAGVLFREAEYLPAPEQWYPLVFGTLLKSAPNAGNISPADYIFGIIDVIMYDYAVCERRYEPGFSVAVVAAATRQVRRTSHFVPTAAEVIKACQEHRRAFRDLQLTVETLINLRANAEAVRAEFDRQWRENFGDDDDEPIPPRSPGGRHLVDDDDEEDLPF